MATTFNSFKADITNARTLVYTAPVGSRAIVFAGQVSNYDPTKASHTVKFEVKNGGSYYLAGGPDIEVDYGAPLKLVKLVLLPAEELYVTGDANSVLRIFGSVVEGL
jgi:hypothetical protein